MRMREQKWLFFRCFSPFCILMILIYFIFLLKDRELVGAKGIITIDVSFIHTYAIHRSLTCSPSPH
jgi:hypothetical protein